MLHIGIKEAAAKKTLIVGLLGWLLAVPGLAPAETPLARVVVFGDSLSDPGNAFALKGGTNTPPDYSQDFFLVPDRPYARGGHHFSNGATWIEQLARSKGLAASVQPAFRGSSAGAANYAVGGARAYNDGINLNLADQVSRFLQDAGGAAPSALYVIEVGGNDIRDVAATRNASILGLSLAAIQENIVKLYTAGARRFLVWNAPKVAVTPAIRAADAAYPGTAAAVDGLTIQYNAKLDELLSYLRQTLGGTQVLRFNAYEKVQAIYLGGAAFGLSEVNTPCITPNVAPFACQNPDDYMFWDGIHPTSAVHTIIAQDVASLLGP